MQLIRACFHYTERIKPLLPKSNNFKPSAILCDSTARFVSDLVGNPYNRFSRDVTQNIPVDTCYISGNVKALIVDNPFADLVIGNVGHVKVDRNKGIFQAVETRAIKDKRLTEEALHLVKWKKKFLVKGIEL